jgi:putative ABC transport system permease protein
MFKNYLKIALKVFARRKFFTAVSLFGISFTLLVLMVAAAVADHTFSAAAPESRLGRTLCLYEVRMIGPRSSSSGAAGYGFLERFLRDLPHTDNVSFFSNNRLVASYQDGEKLTASLKQTDGAYWEIYDFDFIEGAAFTHDDEASGNHVAVINETSRERLLGGGKAVGRDIRVDEQTFRVVGVVRDVPIIRQNPFSDIWVPISTTKSTSYKQQWRGGFKGVVLARSPSDFPQIKAEFERRLEEAQLPDPERFDRFYGGVDTKIEWMSRGLFSKESEAARPGRLRALFAGMMLLFMLLPAINLINLNLSRIMERASEIGVRKAFGASSLSLVGQFVVENVILTVIGGVIGYGLSIVALDALNRSDLIPYAQFQPNLKVFVYGLVLSVIFGLLSGVWPAWRMSRLHPVEALRGRSL